MMMIIYIARQNDKNNKQLSGWGWFLFSYTLFDAVCRDAMMIGGFVIVYQLLDDVYFTRKFRKYSILVLCVLFNFEYNDTKSMMMQQQI